MRKNLLLIAVILLSAVAAFSPATRNGPAGLVDDNGLVFENPKITSLSLPALGAVWATPHIGLYVPLVLTSYAVEYRFFGLNAGAYHATNLLLHAANALLVFWLFLRIYKRKTPAFIVAMLFALHPLNVEPVAWISGRKDVLYAFFFLLAFIFYEKDEARFGKYYFLSLAAFLLSLFSKAMAVTLPLLLFMTDAVLRGEKVEKALKRLAPFFLAALLFAALNVIVQYRYTDGALSISPASVAQRLFYAAHTLVFYLQKALVPVPLSFQYALNTSALQAVASLGILAALAAVTIFSMRFTRTVAWGALFFALALLPALNIIPFGLVMPADRYTYIALLGILYLVAGSWTRVYDRAKHGAQRAALVVFLALLFAGASYISHERCGVWKDDRTLLADTIQHNPSWPRAHMALGQASLRAGDAAAGVKNLEKAVALDGNNAEYHLRLGDAYYGLGRREEARELYVKAGVLDPRNPAIPANLGVLALVRGERDSARAYFEKAVALNSNDARIYYNLILLYSENGEKEKALDVYRRAMGRDALSGKEALERLKIGSR